MTVRKTYPMQASKIMHGLWGMGQMMFTNRDPLRTMGMNNNDDTREVPSPIGGEGQGEGGFGK